MILELVLFKSPPGMDRAAILEDARHTIPRWRANPDLVRKHYLVSDDGYGGGAYIWPSKEAAQRGHDVAWREGVKKRTGSEPVILRPAHGGGQRGRLGHRMDRERRRPSGPIV